MTAPPASPLPDSRGVLPGAEVPSPAGPGWALALQAAERIAGAQDYPQAALYVVATPIGNLADISLRALHVLQHADAIACEDTRHSAALLRAWGLHRPLLALHAHNEAQASAAIVQRLGQGQRVALISDAGTPAISDPGARLVHAARQAGHRVLPIPGASSLTALLSTAGLIHGERGFRFLGFLPPKASARAPLLQELGRERGAVVLLEAPHRMPALAGELAALGPRQLTVGRELTKQFEEIATLPCAELGAWLAAHPQRLKGEFVLVLHPPADDATDPDALSEREHAVLARLLEVLPLKTAVQLAAELLQRPKNTLYPAALAWQAAARRGAPEDDSDPGRRAVD